MAQNQANRLVIVPDGGSGSNNGSGGNGVVRSRRSLVTTNRGMEIIEASGEIGERALENIGNITRSGAGTVRAAGAVRDMLKKGAEATREIPQEEADAERAIYLQFLHDVKSAVSHTNQATLVAQAKATQRLQAHTLADDLEDVGAGLADSLLGRPIPGLHSAQRLLNGGK